MHTIYVSLHTAPCLPQTQCTLTLSGWVPECTWAPAGQGHEISVACLVMCMYVSFPYVNVWMCSDFLSCRLQAGCHTCMFYLFCDVLIWLLACKLQNHGVWVWHLDVCMQVKYGTCLSSIELQNNVLTWTAVGQTSWQENSYWYGSQIHKTPSVKHKRYGNHPEMVYVKM